MINFSPVNLNKGASIILFVLFFMFISTAVSFSVSRSVYSSLLGYRLIEQTKQAHFAAESLGEDVAYRNMAAMNVDMIETATLFNVEVTATSTSDAINGLLFVEAEGDKNDVYRQNQIVLVEGVGASFNYGIQTGQGGILLENGSSVSGNVFSNGSIVGNKSGSGAKVYGSVISAGPTGWIEEVSATGSVWAHTIHDVISEGDAYYVVEDSASVVWGVRNCPGCTSPGDVDITPADQATATMPIPDDVIEMWEDNLDSGGTLIAATDPECAAGPTVGTYTISSDAEIGNVKIECNLEVTGPSTDLILTGPVWVVGNVEIDQVNTVTASTSMSGKTVQLIADDRSDRANSGKFTIAKTVFVEVSGDPNSNIKLISMNDAAATGGTEIAFTLTNSIDGNVSLYAPHGAIELSNNQTFESLTGYQIYLRTGADVIYDSGLKNELFDSGPGGGYTITDWIEI